MQRGDEEKAQTKTLMANLKAKVLSIPNKPKCNFINLFIPYD